MLLQHHERRVADFIGKKKSSGIDVAVKKTTAVFLAEDHPLDVDAVIFAPGEAVYGDFTKVNNKLMDMEVPFIPVYFSGLNYLCGPFVFPWQTPCLECSFTHHIAALNRSGGAMIAMPDLLDLPLSRKSQEVNETVLGYITEMIFDDLKKVNDDKANFTFYRKEMIFGNEIGSRPREKRYHANSDCACCHGMNRTFIRYHGKLEIPELSDPFDGEKIQYHVGGLRSKTEAETRAIISRAVNELGLDIKIRLVEENIFSSVLPVYDSQLSTTHKNSTSLFLAGGTSHGKGLNKNQAYFSAAFELFERLSSRYYGTDVIIRATPKEVERYRIDLTKITSLIGNIDSVYDRYDEHGEIDWTWGKSLISGEAKLIPASTVFLCNTVFKGNFVPNGSSGLSAGAALKDAVLQGLFEVIEHDAWMIGQANTVKLPVIDENTIQNPEVRAVINKIKNMGFNIIMRDYTTDLGIPVVRTWISDERNYTKYAFNGFGCSVDAELAIERSVTEAVQGFLPAEPEEPSDYGKINMVNSIHSRDSFFGMYYFHDKDIRPGGVIKSVQDLPSRMFNHVDEALQYVVNQLKVKLPDCDVLFVDLTRKEFGIPAVKVIVTGDIQRLSEPLVTVSKRLFDFPVHMGYGKNPSEYKDLYLGPYQH